MFVSRLRDPDGNALRAGKFRNHLEDFLAKSIGPIIMDL
jgi:hypothetical protein